MATDDELANELQAWLVGERGFVVVNEPSLHDEAAVRIVDLARPPIIVRLVTDRGLWSIEVAGPDGHWVDLELWRDYLDGCGYSAGPSAFADCARILRARLDEITALASATDFAPTASRLAEVHRERAVARYGQAGGP